MHDDTVDLGFESRHPQRWDDQAFENRLKHLLTSDKLKTRRERQQQQAASAEMRAPPARLKSADMAWRAAVTPRSVRRA